MTRRGRWLLGAAGAAVLLFGWGCLNYTNAWGLDHHREAARQYGLPEPSGPIHRGGMAATAAGAALLGFAVGRRPPASPQKPT
jgi:hypothetical protein